MSIGLLDKNKDILKVNLRHASIARAMIDLTHGCNIHCQISGLACTIFTIGFSHQQDDVRATRLPWRKTLLESSTTSDLQSGAAKSFSWLYTAWTTEQVQQRYPGERRVVPDQNMYLVHKASCLAGRTLHITARCETEAEVGGHHKEWHRYLVKGENESGSELFAIARSGLPPGIMLSSPSKDDYTYHTAMTRSHEYDKSVPPRFLCILFCLTKSWHR